MRKAQLLIAIAFCISAGPILAQAAEAQVVKPGLFEGPNFALALMAIVQIIAIVAAAGVLRSLTSNTAYFAKFRKLIDEGGIKTLLLGIFLTGSMGQAFAQAEQVPAYPAFFRDQNTLMLVALNALLLFVFVYLISLIRRTIAMLMPPVAQVEEAPAAKEESAIMAALTDAVPVEREHEIMMDHEYDGIRELDNNLPPWWVWMFYATIIFAVVYLAWYHVLPYSMNQHEQYAAEMIQAEEDKAAWVAKRGEMVDESNVEFLADAADLKAGRSIFMQHCQACHAADGGGGVGPNLTDEYWIHGGGIKDVFGVVKYGVPTKGMIAWQAQLRPKEIAQVSSYILTLTGTTPAAPKEPQGDIWVEPNTASESDAVGTEVIDEQGGEADDTNPAETSAATAAVQ
jgi:cytochrome c oxidase cbb3-type subunit III